MSGIAGILHDRSRPPVASGRLEAMLDALAHRGRGGRGRHHDSHAAIGIHGLDNPDAASDREPFISEDGRVVSVYDGRCDNHAELRRELESAGAVFRTRSDAELVVHGFRLWGARGLATRMIGVYAFGIWEHEERRAWLVRDRLGARPLYYVDRNGRFAFSSELRSVTRSGLVKAKVDETALWGYLSYESAPGEQSLVSGVLRLPAAHLLEWRDGQTRIESYWELPDHPGDIFSDRNEQARKLLGLLRESLGQQSESDVSVGCLLGGDLESSLVTCLMAERNDAPLRTYSLGFAETADASPSKFLGRVAEYAGAEHRELVVTESEIVKELPQIIWSMDEPIANPSSLSTYFLARAAAREVDLVVAGTGGQELFGADSTRRSVPGQVDRERRSRERVLDWSRLSRSLSGRLGRVVTAPRMEERSPRSGLRYAFDAGTLWSLLHPDRRATESVIREYRSRLESRVLANLGSFGPLQATRALTMKLWVANGLMPMLDRMAMTHSLPSRTPFLDHRVVELAFHLPEDARAVVSEAAARVVPHWMKAEGPPASELPLGEWFRGPLKDVVLGGLLEGHLADAGILDRAALEALFVAHAEFEVDLSKPLWQLLCLSHWLERLTTEIRDVEPMGDVAPVRTALTDDVSGSDWESRIDAGCCDVIVPIYGGVNFVGDLLRSLERHTDYPHRIILIDDSEDDATHAKLKQLASGTKRTELYRNETNLGFVGTSNRGFSLGRSEFVCLLNSDTIVTDGWLERMVECAEHDSRVAIVNPLSNKAVNLSVPMPPGMNTNTMAKRVVEVSKNRYPDITTAVGYCMLIRRRYLDWLGGFDPVYGKGYCEESDLCMRYTEAGLRVVIAENAFVYHKGSGSFGSWFDRYLVNREIFDERWTEAYARDYGDFLRRNPIQYVRDVLLRHTLPAEGWDPEAVDRLERTGLPVVDLERESALTVAGMNPDSVAGARERRAAIGAMPRTHRDPEHRSVRFPTRSYIDSLNRIRLTDVAPGEAALRITFLVASMPISGGITAIVQIAREMILAGHDVRFVTESHELDPERFNLPVQPLIFANREELIRLFPASDVVVATYWTTAADYLSALRERYDFVSAYYLQDYEVYFYPEDDHASRAAVASTYGVAEHRLVESQWVEDLIRQNDGFDCDRVHLGLDLGIFWDRKGSSKVGSPPQILSVARPHERRRGFLEVVDVFDRIHRIRPDIEFVFFGTPDHDMPRQLPFPYRNEGRIQDLNRVAELISSADVLVDSSLFQGFGRPGLEAMACGTPCVLTSEGGIAEYARHDENCLVVTPRLTGKMSDAILRLVDDQPLRERLRLAGFETAKRFSHVRAAQEHLRHYKEWFAAHVQNRQRDGRVAS